MACSACSIGLPILKFIGLAVAVQYIWYIFGLSNNRPGFTFYLRWQLTPKLWPKIEIKDGCLPPSWIFENQISEHWDPLGCWFSITVSNLAQKCWSTPKLWPKIEIKDGSRPPSWICYVIISDHPRSLFIGPHRPVKFYANPMYSFEDMTIWNFCRFGLKFHAPKILVFGGQNP